MITPRLAMPEEAALTPDQRLVRDEAVAGVRGKVPVPMIAWLRNPELARRAQRLGELLRFETSLDPALSELAILVCARHWTAPTAWTAHKREGLKAGIAPATIAAIAARERPVLADPRAAAVHAVAEVLLRTGRIPDDAYAAALAVLGERMLVELVAVVGYYSFAALTLNAFRLALPDTDADELGEPPNDGA